MNDSSSSIEPSKILFTPKANSMTTQVKTELKEEVFESRSIQEKTYAKIPEDRSSFDGGKVVEKMFRDWRGINQGNFKMFRIIRLL